jgi:hypothetical protein
VDFSKADLRGLFDSLHGKHSRPVYWSVLAPWIEAHADEREFLRSFATRPKLPFPCADAEELRHLYALGRVNETLLLRFQRGRADGSDWSGPDISADDYLRFADSLGFYVAEMTFFSPFYHEIVEVEQAHDED